MQARHERWTVIYNANLDQDEGQRKSVTALRAALVKWEEGREKDEKERAKAVEGLGTGGTGPVGRDYEVRGSSCCLFGPHLPSYVRCTIGKTPVAVSVLDRASTSIQI